MSTPIPKASVPLTSFWSVDFDIPLLRLATLSDIEAACNHPDVLPFVAPGQSKVVCRFYDQPGNIALGDEKGVALFGFAGNGCYEGHWCLTPAIRGKAALLFGKAALYAMFTRYKARVIYGEVPRDFRAARLMDRALGFRPISERTADDGRKFLTYVLEREEWALQQGLSLAQL